MPRAVLKWFALLALVALAAGCAGSNAESEATGTIAFVRGSDNEGRHIWLMRADGSEQRALTQGISPAWSPDGRRIAFVSGVPGKYSEYVFVIEADGSGRRQVSPTREEANYEVDKEPVWSPDGRLIAFDGRDYGATAVYIVGADGRGERRLAPARARVGGAVSPTWSPDGRTIAYTDGLAGVFVVGSDGSRRRLLLGVRRFLYSACCYETPTWSPDGRWIAFTRNDRLWVVEADGTRPRRVAYGDASHIAWSPDGRNIAFSLSDRDDEIFVAKADGSGLRNLTDHDGNDVSPTWSPDGQAIAFVSDRDGNTEVYVMNADGSDQRNVSNNPDADSDPVWSPNG